MMNKMLKLLECPFSGWCATIYGVFIIENNMHYWFDVFKLHVCEN